MRRILKEIAIAAWLPVTAGILTFATNWLVWFVVGPDCVPLPDAPCPKLPWGRYITYEVLGDCYLYSFLAMSVTGGSDAMLFIRELRNREKDKKIADERLDQEKQQRAEDRQRYDEQQKINAQQRAEDLKRADRQLAEERERADRQLAENRERYDRDLAENRERNDRMLALTENMMQQAAEERAAAQARADADRQALVESQSRLADALARFTDALERNSNRNGS